jgi:Right handed beta helix region
MRPLWVAVGLALAACGGGGGAGATGSDAGLQDATGPDVGRQEATGSDGGAQDAAYVPDSSNVPPVGDTGPGGGVDGGAPMPTPVCGTSLLAGPTGAPAGAVTLSPGPATIQDAIAAHPAGTTYYLTAGTYSISSSVNPNDNDTFIGAPGAIIDGANMQQVAFGLNDHASGVTIKYLTIQHFVGPQNNGIVNQGQGSGWTLQYDTIENNPDTNGGANGIMLGDKNVVSYNCLTGNGQTGISSNGSSGFVVDHNEVSLNAQGYEAAHPCGCSGGMKFFTSTKGIVTNNWIHDNGNVGLWIDTNNSFFLIQGNVIEKNYAEGIMYEISYNGVVDGNLIEFNGIEGNAQASDFPEPSIYVSESGGYDAGAAVMLSGVDVNGILRITNNRFYDNADGIVLYQNAGRCCGAQDGCSASCGTLPLYSEVDADGNKRWNTQNVTVSNNTFTYDADAGCTTQSSQHNYCAVTGLFSTAATIDQAIELHQNNLFENNTYTGPWKFLSPDQGSSLLSPPAWQAAPFDQDRGSVFQ